MGCSCLLSQPRFKSTTLNMSEPGYANPIWEEIIVWESWKMRVWFERLGVSCSRTAYGVGSAPPPCTPHEYRCMTSHQHLQERQAPIAATIIVTNFGTQPRFIQKYLSIAHFVQVSFKTTMSFGLESLGQIPGGTFRHDNKSSIVAARLVQIDLPRTKLEEA
jgi:hypothetical protein